VLLVCLRPPVPLPQSGPLSLNSMNATFMS